MYLGGNANLVVQGQNTSHTASCIKISQEGSSLSEIRCYGADGNTRGTFQMRLTSSDGSPNMVVLAADGNGAYSNSFLLSNDGTPTNYRWQFYLSGNDLFLNDRHYGTVLSSPTGTGKIRIAQIAASSITNLNVTVNGELTTATSDGSLKENVEDINYGIDEVLKLKPVSYYWKDKEYGSDKEIGFIAQDIEKVIPEVVTENIKTKLKNVNYEKLTSLLTKAMQEQQTIIEDLKSRIETLEG